jgi:hypothetical protein
MLLLQSLPGSNYGGKLTIRAATGETYTSGEAQSLLFAKEQSFIHCLSLR